MKKIFSTLLLLAATVLTAAVQAQTINGDLNHNGFIDVGDITLLIDDYLTGENEQLPYTIGNSLLVGTWYTSEGENISFYADDTSDLFPHAQYKFFLMDGEGAIVFYNRFGIPSNIFEVPDFSGNYMVIEIPGVDQRIYLTKDQSVSIQLSQEELYMKSGERVQLTAQVTPEGMGDVSWSTDNRDVAMVRDGLVMALSAGTAIITAEVAGVQATCSVTVTKPYYNNGYEAVDLGLSVKWATMNVGANAPEEYGDYFAWGETEPKDNYHLSTYKWYRGSNNTYTKYCTDSDYGTVDNKTVLDLEDDAAHANWGGTWRMPTFDEFTELRTKCTWIWTTLNGVKGRKVTGPNGNSIFLPAAGLFIGSSGEDAGSDGDFWSSSLTVDVSIFAYCVCFNSSNVDWYNGNRVNGRNVRAVCQ